MHAKLTSAVLFTTLFPLCALLAQDAPAAGPTPVPADQAPAPATPPAAPAGNPHFKTPLERASYALGLNMAANLKRGADDPKKLDMEEVLKGLRSMTKETVSEDFLKGVSFGLFLKQSGVEFDEATMLKATKEALAGEESKLSDPETRVELESIQRGVQERQEAKRTAQAAKNLEQANAFLEKNGKEEGVVTTRSGLQYKLLKDAPQGGKLREGDLAEIILASYTLEGERKDKGSDGKSRKINQSLTKGFAEAFKLMTIGSKYKIWMPPALGFGDMARPGTPANSLLVFEVELLAGVEPAAKPAGAAGTTPAPATATTPPVAVPMPNEATPAPAASPGVPVPPAAPAPGDK